MASPSPDFDWLEVAKWGVPVVFYAGGIWASYKSLAKRVDKLEERIQEQATKEDIQQINGRLDDILMHLAGRAK